MSTVITGTGSFIPKNRIKNSDFLEHDFYKKDGSKIGDPNELIVKKFNAITGIEERRYADKGTLTSDMAAMAAEKAIEDAGIDREELDYIIVGHNFGDVKYRSNQVDQCPSLANRVKYQLKIENPSCVAYDLIFGCPGWLQGMIQAETFIKAGMAKKCLIIGAEMLSRVVDKHDRDSMIFADGAGATIIEKSDRPGGVLSHQTESYSYHEAPYLTYDRSYNQGETVDNTQYIKMEGRKIYNFSLKKVPRAMKICLDKSGRSIDDLKKIFIHQANEKMDDAMCKRFFKLYHKSVPEDVMPMNIRKLGNTSVGTIPILLDMVRRNKIGNHRLEPGDVLIFASVGAGMNLNAMTYEY